MKPIITSDDSGAPGNERGTNLESAGGESITAKRWRHKQLALSLSLPRVRAGRQFGIASTVSDLFVLVFFCSQSNLFLMEVPVKSLSYPFQLLTRGFAIERWGFTQAQSDIQLFHNLPECGVGGGLDSIFWCRELHF